MEEGLALLSSERVRQAFEKAREEYVPTSGRFVLLTQKYHSAAKDLCHLCFSNDEPISRCLGIRWNTQNALTFWDNVLIQNISVGLVDEQTDELMSVRLNKWESRSDSTDEVGVDIGDPARKAFQSFMKSCEAEAQFADHFPYTEMYHMLGLATSPKYRRQGCATQLMEFTLRFLRYLKLPNCRLLKSESTSKYSQRVFDKVGFTCIYKKLFADYKIDGDMVFSDTGEHTCFKIYGIYL